MATRFWYKQTVSEVLEHFEVTTDGLSADDVRVRQKQYGRNALPEKSGPNPVLVFFRQFLSPLMVLLVVAGVGSIALGEVEDAIVIGLAVVVNVVVGFVQEWKAEQAAAVLSRYEIPQTQVRRDGVVKVIPSTDLVPGDVVLLEAGARIPADVRLIEVADVEVDEALLTGEAYPVKKQTAALRKSAALGDRANLAFMGTLMASGRAVGVVTATGVHTQLGDIAQLVSETEDEATPLQQQLRRFSILLGSIIVALAVGLSGAGYLMGSSLQEMISIAIALIVAAIPEGLLIAFTVVLAIGMQRMLKRKALVRRLIAAETLGSVSVVCTDKTGTLTEGKMSVTQIRTRERVHTRMDTAPEDARLVLVAGALNNDVGVSPEGEPTGGHPTERALVSAALAAGIDVADMRVQHARVGEVPFSGERKYMVTQHKADGVQTIVKGAPERVLAMCRLTEADRLYWEGAAKEMTRQGLRVLAVAAKDKEQRLDEVPTELTCLGLVGISDPLRASTRDTIHQLEEAGLRIILITGDHPDTATAIARDAGIDVEGHKTVTGTELDDMSDRELRERIRDVAIFARVSPQHKVRIVKAWKAQKEVVAMIGDGVNDAAAMKASDMGVALGSGTDVAHETSDMVLLDDNLATIVASVREGRVVFDNMRKIIVYLVSDTFSQVVLIGGALLLGLPLPLLAVQILWINLVTDGLPTLALTTERGEADVMQRRPRSQQASLINGEMLFLVFVIGLLTNVGLLLAFVQLEGIVEIAALRTMMFSSLAIGSLIYVFAIRSLRQPIYRMNPFENRWLVGIIVVSIVLQLVVMYVPVMQQLFGTVALDGWMWGIVLGLSSLQLIALEIGKELYLFVQKRYAKSTA